MKCTRDSLLPEILYVVLTMVISTRVLCCFQATLYSLWYCPRYTVPYMYRAQDCDKTETVTFAMMVMSLYVLLDRIREDVVDVT